ncbi:twin-arginine translocase subunit TatC [Verrucomicrobiales bacterium BCK34]|nr:twin-arginine translocase subunit TatC [Verrucomicrobiales bacterium BCK34]
MLKTAFDKLFQIRESASRARPGADEGFDAHEKPFLDHLEDLRTMLMKVGAVLAVSTVICFTFNEKIFELIQIPATLPMAEIAEGVPLSTKFDLITLSPPEFIVLMLKLSFFCGIIISFPFTVYFIFQFIIPGLRQVEKRTIIPGSLVGFVLFLAGVAFAFYLAAPVALKFFYVFENERIGSTDPAAQAMALPIGEVSLLGPDGQLIAPVKEGAEPEAGTPEAEAPKSALSPEMKEEIRTYIQGSFATMEGSNFALRYDETRDKLVIVPVKGGKSVYQIGQYINFIARLVLVFGISFQLPVVVTILVKLDLLTARVMRATRTYAWIIILVAAAILTPPDVMTLGLLGGPMIFLYEVCIIIASIIERGKDKKARAEEEARKTRLQRLYEKPADDLSEEEKAEIHKAEIAQYEKEHAHLYDHESDHSDSGVSGSSETVARDSFHGDPYHSDDDHHTQHDESWHDDDHYWHDGHEDDPHHGEESHEPVQDWPDKDEAEDKNEDKETSAGMESDHAEPEDLEPGEDSEEDAKADGAVEESTFDDDLHDSEGCEPEGPVVDMNHASKEELMSLPGIGEKLAESIIDHRPFETFTDLEIVPGLTENKVNAMIHRLMLG